MTQREKLIELLNRYFTIGDSYAYNLTRVKEAFAIGTVELDDFVEFDESVIEDIADFLLENGVIVQPISISQANLKEQVSEDMSVVEKCGNSSFRNYFSFVKGL